MIVEKRSRLRSPAWIDRLPTDPVLLIVGILWTGYQVAQGLLRRIGEQNEARSRQPLYVQTATALAQPTQARAIRVTAGSYWRRITRSDLAFQFETNTPQPPQATAVPISTPAPTLAEVTPRPLPTLFLSTVMPAGQSAGGTAIPSPVPTLDRHGDDLMNILLLGNDGEITDDGFLRTDTMIVVSINRTAGTVAMLSLPRDLYVYMPGWTMQRLNLAYIHGQAGGWPGRWLWAAAANAALQLWIQRALLCNGQPDWFQGDCRCGRRR